MATEDDFAHIWYADANGNVTGYVVNGGDKASSIIDAFNEHFGTEISIWTPETKNLQVGGTVPNWDAYEKIEINAEYYQIADSEQKGIFGYVKGSIFNVFTDDEQKCYIANQNGEIIETYNPTLQQIEIFALQKLSAAGVNVENLLADITTFSIGETISNWSQYEII